jgi:hypothetical protein
MDKPPRYYKNALDSDSFPIKELPNLIVLNAKKYHGEVLQSDLDWVIAYYNQND